jgi:hypothetical protein
LKFAGIEGGNVPIAIQVAESPARAGVDRVVEISQQDGQIIVVDLAVAIEIPRLYGRGQKRMPPTGTGCGLEGAHNLASIIDAADSGPEADRNIQDRPDPATPDKPMPPLAK